MAGMESITTGTGDVSDSSFVSVFEPGSYTDSRRPSSSALQNLFDELCEKTDVPAKRKIDDGEIVAVNGAKKTSTSFEECVTQAKIQRQITHNTSPAPLPHSAESKLAENSDVEPAIQSTNLITACAVPTLPACLESCLEKSKEETLKFSAVLSEMNEYELMIPRRLQSLLDEALLYEQHLLKEKERLRQRLMCLSSILSKAQ